MTEKSKEHSAIDSIYSMEESVNNLSKRVEIFEGMLLPSNKLDQLSKKNQASAPAAVVKVDSSQKQVSPTKVEKLLLGKVKSLWKDEVNKSLQPLYGVLVNIYDSSSELVKSIKTDDEGLWEVRLPGGKYGIEYIHKNFKPINRTIEIFRILKNFQSNLRDSFDSNKIL